MISTYFDERREIKEEEIKIVAEGIREGKLALFPTETVYGIGANALDAKAVGKIFLAKGRASDNPLIVHVCDKDMLQTIVEEIGELEQRLIDAFWPGPLTIIFNRKSQEIIPNNVTANLDTVGIRMPSNEIARKLIKLSRVPIAAPSANISGRPSGTNVEDILEELDGRVDYILDGGAVNIGVESTVVRVKEDTIHILRPGKITKEQLERVTSKVDVDKHVLENCVLNEPVASPGMKYRHYAPNTKCILVYSKDKSKMITKINEIAREKAKTLVLGTQENLSFYDASIKLDMGKTLEDVAKNIFTLLRKADTYHVDLVVIEGVGKEGMGLAITNRLLRACEYQYIEL